MENMYNTLSVTGLDLVIIIIILKYLHNQKISYYFPNDLNTYLQYYKSF